MDLMIIYYCSSIYSSSYRYQLLENSRFITFSVDVILRVRNHGNMPHMKNIMRLGHFLFDFTAKPLLPLQNQDVAQYTNGTLKQQRQPQPVHAERIEAPQTCRAPIPKSTNELPGLPANINQSGGGTFSIQHQLNRGQWNLWAGTFPISAGPPLCQEKPFNPLSCGAGSLLQLELQPQ